MKIRLADLKLMVGSMLDYATESYGNFIDFDHDLYWYITTDTLSIEDEINPRLARGDLQEDLRALERLYEGIEPINMEAYFEIYAIVRALGTKSVAT
jgi:hypothetical protein